MKHIETIELDSSQSSITFSSIPQDYDDLIIKFASRTTISSETDVFAQFNSDTSGSYQYLRFFAQPTSVGSNSGASLSDGFKLGRSNSGSSDANTFSSCSVYISNYTDSSSLTSASADIVTEINATTNLLSINALQFQKNDVITSMTLQNVSGDFVSGCTFSLYGVTAGGDGTVSTT